MVVVETARRRYDVAGAVTSTTALILLVLAVSKAPEVGWSARVPISVESMVLAIASRTDSQNEDVSPGTLLHSRYHCSVNPFQAKLTWGRPVVTLLKL